MSIDWSNFWSLMLGLILGYGLAYLKCRLDNVEAKVRPANAPSRSRRDVIHDNIAVVMCLLIVLSGLAWMSIDNRQRDADKNCLRGNLLNVVRVLNARSAITEQHNDATNALDDAQARFLSTVADPDAPATVQREAFLDYVKALQQRREQAKQETEQRAATPPPSESDITKC